MIMNDKNTFCEECRKDVNYVVVEKEMEGTIKGTKYIYIGKEARCEECGSEVYIPEINDSNLKALYDVFREKNDIVSLDIILDIPKKYDIGKRPFSLLLGWGEQTFYDIVMGICLQNNILIYLKKYMIVHLII